MNKVFEYFVKNISYESELPAQWHFDIKSFSKDKSLYEFQQNALKSALVGLWLYNYRDTDSKAIAQYERYKETLLFKKLDIDLKNKDESKIAKFYMEWEDDYPIKDNKISFEYFINRMCFWMATGSGKTLVIVKLIEVLCKLMDAGEIPRKDIVFLTHRPDLIEQFRKHIREFNNYNQDVKIELIPLREYDSYKQYQNAKLYKHQIDVFYIKSDLFSDETKENQVNYRTYAHHGNWYVILDEAHKGGNKDKLSESMRQAVFSIMSRNGFLFNFSATFTDRTDIATCIYNYNLAEFIKNGYGKHLYVSEADVTSFRHLDDYSPREKLKIVLKTFILLTYYKLCKAGIDKVKNGLYHNPMMVTLVNSITAEDSDLKMFFYEIAKVANNFKQIDLIDEAKREIISEFQTQHKYKFETEYIRFDKKIIKSITYDSITKNVFNSDNPGKIEVKRIKNNNQELVFNLQTSTTPFALIKIGDVKDYEKFLLNENYVMTTDFDEESIFGNINTTHTHINLLMGSRAFYEGWDSNRPNLILFINIGVGTDAHKFVLQSVGRGVRIEPKKDVRRRAEKVLGSVIDKKVFDKTKQNIDVVESLVVMGTNPKNVEEIIKSLEIEEPSIVLTNEFEKNKAISDKPLLVPVFVSTENLLAESKQYSKYQIHLDDLNTIQSYILHLSDKILIIKFRCPVTILKLIKDALQEPDKYFDTGFNKKIENPERIIENLIGFYSLKSEEFDTYRELNEQDIVHFKHISITHRDLFDELKEKVNKVKQFQYYEDKKEQLILDFGSDPRTLTSKIEELKDNSIIESSIRHDSTEYSIKYIAQHYYIPPIIRKDGADEFIKHVINVESEKTFINKLLASINDDKLKQFDWWYFSKLDQYYDEVKIPYYSSIANNVLNFKPDFIFWFQKGDKYILLFVDPKGTEHTDGSRKIKGFIDAFTNEKHPDGMYVYNGLKIIPKLLFYNTNANSVPYYREYWFDNISEFIDKVSKY